MQDPRTEVSLAVLPVNSWAELTDPGLSRRASHTKVPLDGTIEQFRQGAHDFKASRRAEVVNHPRLVFSGLAEASDTYPVAFVQLDILSSNGSFNEAVGAIGCVKYFVRVVEIKPF